MVFFLSLSLSLVLVDQHSQQNGKFLCSLIENEHLIINDNVRVHAMKFAFEHLKLVVELTSVLSLAAILSQSDRFDSNLRNIAVIIPSGNLDFNQHLPWLNLQ